MENATLPTWGKEYAEGWDSLVTELVQKLFILDPNLHIAQIKEKFGGLRAYISPSFDADENIQEEFQKLIQDAEEKSQKTCEKCGKNGTLANINGWYKTLCTADEQAIIKAAEEQKAKAQAERATAEQRKAEEIKEAKASTVCRECENEGKYRKSIRNEIAVLCDEHFEEWTKAYEERKAFYLKKREEILAKKEAEK